MEKLVIVLRGVYSTTMLCNSHHRRNQGVLWQSPGGTTKAEIVE